MAVIRENITCEYGVDIVVVGAGACGICAAMRARENGAEVLVLERDKRSTGSTALSTGLIPAAGTKLQREMGIDDSAETFAADLMKKARNQTDPDMVQMIAAQSGPTVDWLRDDHGIPFTLVQGFLYPGHSQLRMHGVPSRTGEELQSALLSAAGRADIDILNEAMVEDLYVDDQDRITAVAFRRPDGKQEIVATKAVILACNGYGGSPDLLHEHIPEIVEAEFWGHIGNTGDALRWGQDLGAATADLGAYQGHGAVATPYGRPMMWGLITEGGFQVNLQGERFSNEASGYSEQAYEVIRQPNKVAFNIYDEIREKPALDFTDYREVVELGGIKRADTLEKLAQQLGLPGDALKETMRDVDAMRAGEKPDPWGRDFTTTQPLKPPYCGVRVTGALFHTQGGLRVDQQARVMRRQGGAPLPNLFAGGGAARGVSGPSRWGYLSGNGLLAATVLGRVAGQSAAEMVKGTPA